MPFGCSCTHNYKHFLSFYLAGYSTNAPGRKGDIVRLYGGGVCEATGIQLVLQFYIYNYQIMILLLKLRVSPLGNR